MRNLRGQAACPRAQLVYVEELRFQVNYVSSFHQHSLSTLSAPVIKALRQHNHIPLLFVFVYQLGKQGLF